MANKSKDVKNKIKTNPAGVKDNFRIVGVDINNVIENDKYVLETGRLTVDRPHLSTDLVEGMSIKAHDGVDYDKIAEFKERKDKKVNFKERKQQKDNEEQVI